MSGRSVFRPPTPEPESEEEDGKEQSPSAQGRGAELSSGKLLSIPELVDIKFLRSGKKERLQGLLRKRLIDCGWRDQLAVDCRAYIRKIGKDNLSTNDLVRYITPKARALVPGPIKAELLQEIQSILKL